MSQRHFQDSIHDDNTLDPQFKSLLKHHWMEEMQHAQLDTLMVETIAAGLDQKQIDQAIEGYFAIGEFLDNGLKQQTAFDLEAFEAAGGCRLTPEQHDRFMSSQHQANRWTYIGSGMTHPNFVGTMGKLSGDMGKMLELAAPRFC
jgi:hypothetical protein